MRKNEQSKKAQREQKRMKERYSLKTISKIRRDDGLRPKCVREFTMRSVLECAGARYGKLPAMRTWRDEESLLTYHQMELFSRRVGLYLLSHGFSRGDKIALMGEGSPLWMTSYLGITSVALTAVPILPEFPARDVVNIVRVSRAKAIIVNGRHFEKCLDLIDDGVRFFRLEDMMEIPSVRDDVRTKAGFLEAPGIPLTSYKIPKDGEKVWKESKPDEEDIASLIFTSGTTGRSKGVLLTHRNLVWDADICSDTFFKVKKKSRVLSFLPLSHVYEFTTAQVLGLLLGCDIFYLGKPAAPSFLMPALSEVRPRIMMSVPLLMEKVYKSAVKPVFENGNIAKWLKWGPTRRFISRTAGRKLKLAFGGRLKFFGIGGAPMDAKVEQFLYDAKFPYAQGYGLTETSPMICGHGPKDHHLGMLGKVLRGEEVRLDDRNAEGVGEILVRGPNVMKGYYENPELNRESFTEDGFFRTGDLGQFDRKGRLGLRGRTKTMILGSGGENIYPEAIETLINSQDFVSESLVVPEKGGLLALIKIDLDSLAASMSISVNDAKAEAGKYIASLKQRINKELASFSRISSVKLQEEPFERTPTMKIKRFLYGLTRKDEERDAGKEEQGKGRK